MTNPADVEKAAEKYLSDIESLILFSPDTPNEMLYEAKKKELVKLLTSLTPKPTTADDVNKLYDLVKIQVNDPSSKTDQYIRGMANGLICALAIFKKWEPIYIDAPKQSVPKPTKEDGEVVEKIVGIESLPNSIWLQIPSHYLDVLKQNIAQAITSTRQAAYQEGRTDGFQEAMELEHGED